MSKPHYGFDTPLPKSFSEIDQIDQGLILKTGAMQLFRDIFLLAHQLRTMSGIRVIDNGMGPPVFGAEEIIADFALLASDQKATLPSQVQAF